MSGCAPLAQRSGRGSRWCAGLLAAGLAGWLPSASFAAPAAPDVDTDLDGVFDMGDAFPCDWRRAAVTFVPGESDYATLLLEDNWPARGDLDFNDAVLLHHVAVFSNGGRQVTGLRVTLVPRAVGAQILSGVGLRLPLPASSIASIQRSVGTGAPATLNVLARETELVIPVVTSLRDLFNGAAGFYINTDLSTPNVADGNVVTVEIEFHTPVDLPLAAEPFDLYFFRTDDPGHQIHRPQFSGTETMRDELFGTLDDGSTGQRYFVDQSGLPFLLSVPQQSLWPLEQVRVERMWPNLTEFAESGGASAADFYESRVNRLAAYPAPENVRAPGVDFAACLAPSCTDGARNGVETDVDCGGGCGPCGRGSACRVHDDCAGGVCAASACVESNERTCALEHGSGAQLRASGGAPWAECQATACESGFHVEAGVCAADDRACAIAHGSGTQTWADGAWGACRVLRCDASFHVASGACESDTRTCAILNGSGSQSWSGGWGACQVTGCDPGHHVEAGACAADTRACAIAQGTGTQTWNGTEYGTCTVSSCDSGYRSSAHACVQLTYAWSTGAWGACTGGTGSPSYGSWGACTGGAGSWSYSPWGACSAAAVCSGSGTQSRSAACNFTASSGSQARTASCVWEAGSGSQGRTVDCLNNFGETVPNNQCTGGAPAASQTCTPSGTPASCGTLVSSQACTPSDAAVCGASTTSQTCASPAGSQSCPITNGTGTQSCALGGTTWGTCAPASCNSGFHIEGGACLSDTRACAITNGSGTQTWNGSAYGTCNVASCNSGYHAYAGACVLLRWDYGSYGSCTGGTATWTTTAFGACSSNCTNNGTQSRTVSCSQDANSGSQSRSATCQFNSAGVWTNHPSGASGCTTSIGAASGLSQSCTPSAAACSPGTQPAASQSCTDLSRCDYDWIPSSWSGCSGGTATWSSGSWGSCSGAPNSCGTGSQTRTNTCNQNANSGTQTRSMSCQRRQTGELVGDSFCSASGTRPGTSQSCTPTSASCGAAPASSQTCSQINGCTPTWNYGGWGACSNSCGGSQTRSASCQEYYDNAWRPAQGCPGSPATSQGCGDVNGLGFAWTANAFGACYNTNTCGSEGQQDRYVYCRRVCDGADVGTTNGAWPCFSGAPATSQFCWAGQALSGCYRVVTNRWVVWGGSAGSRTLAGGSSSPNRTGSYNTNDSCNSFGHSRCTGSSNGTEAWQGVWRGWPGGQSYTTFDENDNNTLSANPDCGTYGLSTVRDDGFTGWLGMSPGGGASAQYRYRDLWCR